MIIGDGGNVPHNFATLLRSLHMIVVAGDFKCKTGKELCGLWTMCSCIATVDLAEIVESLTSLMDFSSLKKLWCCVSGRKKNKNLVLSNELIKVEIITTMKDLKS